VPCGRIYTIDQVFEDPQVVHLDMVKPIDSPSCGPLKLIGQPMTLSRTPSAVTSPPPEAGEHSEQILREYGFSAGEIEGFRRQGII
jgi:formyl-CoA transferase